MNDPTLMTIEIVCPAIVVIGVAYILWYFKHVLPKKIEGQVSSKVQKEVADHQKILNEQLENHKDNLKKSTDKELEEVRHGYVTQVTKLSHDLQAANHERNYRYSLVFDRCVRALEVVYAKIYDIQKAANAFATFAGGTNTDPNKFNEERSTLLAKLSEFRDIYAPNRIYFPDATKIKIDGYIASIHAMLFKFSAAFTYSKVGDNRAYGGQLFNQGLEHWDKLVELIGGLEKEFQRVLGLKDEEKPLPATTESPIDVVKILYGFHENEESKNK
jgi:hypothetical protein